jgi:hypothetical protein
VLMPHLPPVCPPTQVSMYGDSCTGHAATDIVPVTDLLSNGDKWTNEVSGCIL